MPINIVRNISDLKDSDGVDDDDSKKIKANSLDGNYTNGQIQKPHLT